MAIRRLLFNLPDARGFQLRGRECGPHDGFNPSEFDEQHAVPFDDRAEVAIADLSERPHPRTSKKVSNDRAADEHARQRALIRDVSQRTQSLTVRKQKGRMVAAFLGWRERGELSRPRAFLSLHRVQTPAAHTALSFAI